MLHDFTDAGVAHWVCPHCQSANHAHFSHEEIETSDHIVALPTCACGTRTMLKASFTQEELQATNMIDTDGAPTQSRQAAHLHMRLRDSITQRGSHDIVQS